MKYLKLVIMLVIILVLVALVHLNNSILGTNVVFEFGFNIQSPAMYLWVVLLIVFFLGVLITSLVGIVERFKLKKRIKILMRESKEKDKELNSLRNLPITSDNVVSGSLGNSANYS